MAGPHTIIVGAGLSGLCLAHALAATGGSVAAFERDPGPDVRGQGYRLTIDETGRHALRACLPSRNYEFIRATAGVVGKTGAFMFLDERARELHRFSFDLEAGERRGHITGQVDRRTLRQALLSGLYYRVQFGKAITGYEERPCGGIAHFSDGSTAEADILIGADGVNSRVRRQPRPEAEPRDTGISAIFGRTPLSRVDLPVLGRLLANAGIMALGPRGQVFFCTAMRFRELPATAAVRLGIEGGSWPSDDYFMWAVAFRKHDRASVGKLEATALREIAGRAVRGFHDDFQVLVREADPNEAVIVPIRATPPLKPPTPRRITLIGDAIHTMPPFGAHGANTAFKDAHTLAAQLSNGTRSFSVAEAIGSYESSMRLYSRPVMKSALRMMTMATTDFPFKQMIFQTVLRAAGAFSR